MAIDVKEISRIARSYAEDVKRVMPVEKQRKDTRQQLC